MTKQISKRRSATALLFATTLLGAACGSSSDGGSTEATSDAGSAAFEQLDLSALEITVGSKDFTEQLVLGEILVQSFEAAGATVTNQVDLGGTVVNREALLAGEIDVYAEYNGTGWTLHLAREYSEVADADGSVSPEALTAAVREADLAENNIHWLSESPFNDTYGFASSPELLDGDKAFTMQTMADYLAANPDATVCMESEFPSRPDGLVLFEEGTGFELPESQTEILDTGLIYTETQSGACDFGEVFTTDGRIAGLGLNLVDDPGLMIIYNVSVNVPDALYQEAPEAFDEIAEKIFAPLDNATMTALNHAVDIEGKTAAAVAEEFLRSNGLIS